MTLFFNFPKHIDRRALGASLYYGDISDYLKSKTGLGIRCEYEEFSGPGPIEKKMKALRDDDIVLSNIGPFAWIYFYFREKYNKKFRIIRDIPTSLWIGYFLQEFLIRAFVRKGDCALFPSEYNRQLYRNFFPAGITDENSAICHPSLFKKPKTFKSIRVRRHKSINLGWLGRISKEKNFDVALRILNTLSRDNESKLYLRGPVQPEYESEFRELIRRTPRRVAKNIIHMDHGKFVDKEGVYRFFENIDLLLFPSVASMESLGRVVIEASSFDIPVIAANYAAMPELIPPEHLADVTYREGVYDLYRIHSIGMPDIRRMTQLCRDLKGKRGVFEFNEYDYSYKKLTDIIRSKLFRDPHRSSSNAQSMIKNMDILVPDLKSKKEGLLEKAVKYLHRMPADDIALAPVRMAEHLGFHPYFRIKHS